MPRTLIVSPAADRRLERAAAWLGERRRDEEILILGASLEAPAEMVSVTVAESAVVPSAALRMITTMSRGRKAFSSAAA